MTHGAAGGRGGVGWATRGGTLVTLWPCCSTVVVVVYWWVVVVCGGGGWWCGGGGSGAW